MPSVTSIGPQDADLTFEIAGRFHRAIPALPHHPTIFGMDHFQPDTRRIRLLSTILAPALVANNGFTVNGGAPDHLRYAFDENPVRQPVGFRIVSRNRLATNGFFQFPVALFDRGMLLLDLPLHPEFFYGASNDLLQCIRSDRIFAGIVQHTGLHRLYG